MNKLYKTIGVSKQAVYQYAKRQHIFDNKLSNLMTEAEELRDEHPGCGVEKMYDALKPGGIMFITESTLQVDTVTARTQQGWVDLCQRHGFKLIKFWHKNGLGLEDHYLFIKEKKDAV